MKPFVFRAETALIVRRREEEAAERALAAAERRRIEAERAWQIACDALAAGYARGREEEAQPGELTLRVWHRNWIVGQQRVIAGAKRELDARTQEQAAAAERAIAAQRKRKALERLREHALAMWRARADRDTQRAIDELANVRFLRARSGGTS